MLYKSLSLTLILGISTLHAMEEGGILKTISPSDLGFNRTSDTYIHALRNFCQALYFNHRWITTAKSVPLIIEFEEEKKAESQSGEDTEIKNERVLSRRIETPLRKDEALFMHAYLSLQVLEPSTLSEKLQFIHKTLQELLNLNAFLQGTLEKEAFAKFVEAVLMKEDLERTYKTLALPALYANARRILSTFILRNGAKNSSLLDYSKATTGEALPMVLEVPPSEEAPTEQKDGPVASEPSKKGNRKKK
jgi:hypothetical protein